MTQKRKVYVSFIENNQKFYVSKLRKQYPNKIVGISYTENKEQALILDEGTVWYNACQVSGGINDITFAFEDVDFQIINSKKDVKLEKNQELLEFHKNQFYIIKETNGEMITQITYRLPRNKIQKEVTYSVSTELLCNGPIYFSSKEYFNNGVEYVEEKENFTSRKFVNDKNETKVETVRHIIPNEFIVSIFSQKGIKKIQQPLELNFCKNGDVEQYFFLTEKSCCKKFISKTDFENKTIPDEIVKNLTAFDWIDHFYLRENELTFAPDKISIEYKGKTFEYSFDIKKYNKEHCYKETVWYLDGDASTTYYCFCNSCKKMVPVSEKDITDIENFVCKECLEKEHRSTAPETENFKTKAESNQESSDIQLNQQ